MKKSLNLVAAILICFSSVALVASNNHINAQAYRGIIIDAFKFDLETVKPGETVTRTFTATYDYQPLSDGTYRSVDIDLYAQNFTQGDVAGEPKFLEKGSLPFESSLADWITVSESRINLDEPNEKKVITFTIKVPENAEPGGKYAALFLQNSDGVSAVKELSEENNSGFGLNAAVGPLIFLTVDGDINKELELEDMYTTNIKGSRTSFFFNHPVNVITKFKNSGNVHISPRGRLYIHRAQNFVADNYIAFDLNPKDYLVLPETSREFNYTWDDAFIHTVAGKADDGKTVYSLDYDFNKLSKFWIGKYKATVQFDYVDENGVTVSTITGTTSFWVIPWQLILVVIIFTLLILTLLVYWKKFRNTDKK